MRMVMVQLHVIIEFRKHKLAVIYPFFHTTLIESLVWMGPVLGAGNTALGKTDRLLPWRAQNLMVEAEEKSDV